jgi:hypothetical protein
MSTAPIEYNPQLPDCYIFDIDGTLAIRTNRGPFDWKRVGEDRVNIPVAFTFINLKISMSVQMFIFSGRDSVCRPETEKWLKDCKIHHNGLFMRPQGDISRDSIVKEIMYEENIKGKYNVLGIFDDRNQVVDMWRSLGLPCYQVAEGDF